MKNLRLLQIDSVHLTGSYEHLSKELKWLHWHKCPLKFLPQNFHLENLVILDMQHSNVKQVWKKKKIFNKLKVLNLSNSKCLTESPDFSQVPQLEILILEGCTSLVKVHESIGYLKRLVLLNLQKCKNLRNLPSSIYNLESLTTLVLSECLNLKKLPDYLGNMMALTVLHVENTAIKQLPSSFSLLKNLETLSLRGSECLIESPKFLETSCLKKLILEGCTSLVEVHNSIGLLKILKELNLGRCKKLRNLPSSISNLELLETLVLSDCLELDKLPEQLGNMKALKFLLAGRTNIEQRPSSLGPKRNPIIMPLLGCEVPSSSRISPKGSKHISLFPSPYELWSLTNLRQLDLSGRNLSEDEFPVEFGVLSSLEILDLSRNNFRNLPDCINYLPELLQLNLNECSTLQSISVPFIVQVFGILRANDCISLERILTLTNESLGSLSLNNCQKLVEIQSSKSLRSGACLLMGRCNNLSPAFRESVLQMLCKTDHIGTICLPGSEIPNWFSHRTIGSSICIRVPSFWGGKIGKMLLCVVLAAKKEAPRNLSGVSSFSWRLHNKTRTHQMPLYLVFPADCFFGSCEDQIFVEAMGDDHLTRGYMKSGDEIEVSVDFSDEEVKGEIQVKKCGIHLLVDEPSVIDTSGDKIKRFFVGKEVPVYAGEVCRIPLNEANATQVDESDFCSSLDFFLRTQLRHH
ncbi:disease resistance protein RPV1-like [Corylus avellana]|uniref:disease resistance protein RPV1-like n=1 Tax=Corylus avellana TaxID=13451 RepID=UPI00286BA322|nr:disease resistance protein RPV1-like [Corylus avellana]